MNAAALGERAARTETHADFEAHDPDAPRRGAETRFLCPFPECAGHQNPRADRALSYNEQNGLWHCHRCDAKGQDPAFWKPQEKPVYGSARERGQDRLRRAFAVPAPKPKPQTAQNASVPVRAAENEKNAALVAAADGTEAVAPVASVAPWRACLGKYCRLLDTPGAAYLEGRGLPARFCAEAGVCFSPDYYADWNKGNPGQAAVIFPLVDASGRSVAAQGRRLSPNARPKALTTRGGTMGGLFVTPGALDGLLLVIVEAPIDALSLALGGMPAVATCGASNFPERLKHLALNRVVVLAHDSDSGGEKAVVRIHELLALAAPLAIVRLRPEGGAKDWNDVLQNEGPDALAVLLGDFKAARVSRFLPLERADAQYARWYADFAEGETGNVCSQNAEESVYHGTHLNRGEEESVQNSGHFEADLNEAEVGNRGSQTVSPGRQFGGDLDEAVVPDELADLVPLARELDAYFDAQEAKERAATGAADAEVDSAEEARRALLRKLREAAQNNNLPVVPVALGGGRTSDDPNASARRAFADLKEAAPKARAKDGQTVKPSRAWWEAKAQSALDDLDALAAWWETQTKPQAAPVVLPSSSSLPTALLGAPVPPRPKMLWVGHADFLMQNADGEEVRVNYSLRGKEGEEFSLRCDVTLASDGADRGGGPLGVFATHKLALQAAQTDAKNRKAAAEAAENLRES